MSSSFQPLLQQLYNGGHNDLPPGHYCVFMPSWTSTFPEEFDLDTSDVRIIHNYPEEACQIIRTYPCYNRRFWDFLNIVHYWIDTFMFVVHKNGDYHFGILVGPLVPRGPTALYLILAWADHQRHLIWTYTTEDADCEE